MVLFYYAAYSLSYRRVYSNKTKRNNGNTCVPMSVTENNLGNDFQNFRCSALEIILVIK